MPITTVPTFGEMPRSVAHELAFLSDALDGAVPSKQLDRNLLVASWNIRELGRVNGKWSTARGDTPKRNFADVHCIAEILSRFDVIAVQEVQDNLAALRAVMLCLGPEWGFQVTDVNFGDAGDGERLAYLYDLRRVRPSGLAGELVLSADDFRSTAAEKPEKRDKTETAAGAVGRQTRPPAGQDPLHDELHDCRAALRAGYRPRDLGRR